MSKRYFEESSDDQFKPGKISRELHNALNLHHDELPIWIYRMRVLGYPPGWLKRAQMNTLEVFDGPSKSLPNASREDGEIAEPQYNPESFVEYPGFNCPLPSGVHDEWDRLGYPPLLENQQLKLALTHLKKTEPVPYKKKKTEDVNTIQSTFSKSKNDYNNTNLMIPGLKNHDDALKSDEDDNIIVTFDANKSDSNKPVDCISLGDDIDEAQGDISNVTDSTDVTPDEIKSRPSISSVDFVNGKSFCVSFNENNTNENNTNENNTNENNTNENNTNENNTNANTSLTLSNEEFESPNKSQAEQEEKQQTINGTPSSSRKLNLIEYGSPVPVSCNSKKPPLEKWAEGMGNLIYFENLPNSTGMFKKMRNIISKIRKELP